MRFVMALITFLLATSLLLGLGALCSQSPAHPGDAFQVYLPLVLEAYEFDRLTYHPANDWQPALSPDGQTVVFISEREGQSDVFSVPLMGGQPVNLTQTPSAQEDTPVFSPDGSTIAFASDRDGDWSIYLMNTDGGNIRPALAGDTGTDELHPSFTPDGLGLAFSSNRAEGNWDIYTAPIGSSEWTRLTTHPAADRFPTLSADGKTIVFRSERDGNSEIYLMDADGSNLRRLTDDPAFDGYPSIIPDGSGVVFVSDRSGERNVYIINWAGGCQRTAAGVCWWAHWRHPRYLQARIHQPADVDRAAGRRQPGGALRLGSGRAGLRLDPRLADHSG